MEKNIERKKEIFREYGHKLMVLGFIGAMVLVSYLFIKYVLPILWPFAAGLILAMIFRPIITFLHKYLHLNKMIGTALVLGLVSMVIVIVSGWLIRGILAQVTSLMENMDVYMEAADDYLCDMCHSIGDAVGVEGDSLFRTVTENIDDFMSGMEKKITSFVMGTSIPAIMAFVELVVGIALVVVSLFLFVKDMEGIRKYLRGFYFHRDMKFITRRVFTVTKAYVKAQLVIMAAVAAECVAGLMILGNKYALLIGILIGVLDALPLFGVGAVLLPWTIIYVASGNFINAAVMFTIFIVCYFTREFLEPKLIGDKIGINPIVTLIVIYAGFKLLGFTGMFMAPLVFIVIRDAAGIFIKFIKS